MYIKDVLDLVTSYNGKIIAGSNGINKTVYSIEVMEVPYVEEWLSPGKLLVTTFFTLKDDMSAQKKLIEKLIANEASGIIVKFGRFINCLPEEILLLAEEKDFPIISIPKEVSYEKILTPLYKKLYVSGNVNLIERLEKYSYENMTSLLNEIHRSFGLVTYIENLHGALIFSGDYSIKDIWRRSNELFSLPNYKVANDIINRISLEYTKYIKHNYLRLDRLNRIIVPLYSKGSKYALLHVVYKREKQKELVLNPIIFRIVDKIHSSIMGEIVNIQRKSLLNKNNYLNWKQKKSSKLVLNISLPFIINYDTMFDPELLLKEEVGQMLKNTEGIDNFYVFLNNNDVYAIISLSKEDLTSSSISHNLFEALKNTKIHSSYIAMSRAFKYIDNYKNKLEMTKKMNQIGMKQHDNTKVFSFEKLGIYTILLDLSNDYYVMDYVNNILKDIKKMDVELFKTLKTFLFSNQNISKTGKELLLNRKTVSNRLSKIEREADIDLDNPETIFILQFCIKILNLKLDFSD